MNVPYLDLGRARRRIDAPLARRWQRILDQTTFVLGPEVEHFEQAFADYVTAPGCVGVANGTDALVIALRALGAGPGDEVLVPAFTFFATAEAVLLVGATPVLCDIDPVSFNLDPEDAAARRTPRTVGIIGVHLYGLPFDASALAALCRRHGLWLIEDAAQAHGARLGQRPAGRLGDIAAWSFYPTKNLGCFGDGGAVTATDAGLVETIRRLANHGQTERYHHVAIGTNSRLDSLQAAVLNCRLPLLDGDNASRRAHAGRYIEQLTGVGDLRLPVAPPEALPVYHQFTVRSARRAALAAHLAAVGIGSSVHYPSPLHRQPALAGLLPTPPDLPHAEAAARQVLCLPMFPELEPAEVDAVCHAVRGFFAGD